MTTTTKPTTASTPTVGVRVLYQPSAEEWPMGHKQHAAIITGWDEDTQKANLLVFPDTCHYTLNKTGVVEGTDDDTFQQLGTSSKTQLAVDQSKQQTR